MELRHLFVRKILTRLSCLSRIDASTYSLHGSWISGTQTKQQWYLYNPKQSHVRLVANGGSQCAFLFILLETIV